MATNGTEELAEELVDYEEEEVADADAPAAAKAGEQVKKGYVGIHSSGFKVCSSLRSVVASGVWRQAWRCLRRAQTTA